MRKIPSKRHRRNRDISGKVKFIYTNIGRGHPFYLDGIHEALIHKKGLAIVRDRSDVFELSSGLSLAAWKVVRAAYKVGASDGLFGRLYASLRMGADYNRPSITLSIMGADIRKRLIDLDDSVLVAHPTLVAILRGKKGLIYQHGELACPIEAVVKGADYVLVPTSAAAEIFIQHGYEPKQVIITGLCIEPSIVKLARDAFESRVSRMNGQESLTGAFFSSGAEPDSHVRKLVTAAGQAVASGGKVILFVGPQGRFFEKATSAFGRWGIDHHVIDSSEYLPTEPPAAMLVRYSNRRELDIFTARLFPTFDYFASPSHERTNWALGLGLPMFVIAPAYGPFAPLNASTLMASGVASIVDDTGALAFGKRLTDLRQHGYLSDMAGNGWKKHDIHGFERAADFLLSYCGPNSLL